VARVAGEGGPIGRVWAPAGTRAAAGGAFMREGSPASMASPAPLHRAVRLLFRLTLGAALLLAPTLFGGLHRLGGFVLLFLVCLLHAFWVVCAVLGSTLWHLKSWANVLVWCLLGLVLFQTLPLPLAGVLTGGDPPVGVGSGVLIEPPRPAGRCRAATPALVRYSLRPGPSTGVLMAIAAATGLYWLVSSALPGRKSARWVTWSAVLGLGVLAYWVVMARIGSIRPPPGLSRLVGPVLVLGGDSLAPALLAALPACLLVVVRLLGWLPRRAPARRESRWGWLDRAGTVRIGIALALTGLVATGLGLCHVPRHVLVVCVVLAVGFVLAGYVVVGPAHLGLRRPVGLALSLGLWVALGLWIGTLVAGPGHPETHADASLEALLDSVPVHRQALGLGAGAVSPRAAFGRAGWPAAVGADVDTDGFLLLRAEVGWVGLVLVLAGAVAFGSRTLSALWRRRGPWSRMAVLAGFGALSANLLYFRFDASALLVPNLLALATVLGVVAAWTAHGAHWRPDRREELGESHWPLVVAAVGLLGALGLAENQMLEVGGGGINADKVLHLGTFAVVSLLLCYALGPKPTTHYLKSRLLLALVVTGGLGALLECGQWLLTEGRSFEWLDMAANGFGAGMIVLLWWVVRRGQAAPVET